MSLEKHAPGSKIPDSFSRDLNDLVAATEMPYGYTNSPPPADSGEYDQRKLESDKRYK